jgi:hypothetical protein
VAEQAHDHSDSSEEPQERSPDQRSQPDDQAADASNESPAAKPCRQLGSAHRHELSIPVESLTSTVTEDRVPTLASPWGRACIFSRAARLSQIPSDQPNQTAQAPTPNTGGQNMGVGPGTSIRMSTAASRPDRQTKSNTTGAIGLDRGVEVLVSRRSSSANSRSVVSIACDPHRESLSVGRTRGRQPVGLFRRRMRARIPAIVGWVRAHGGG